MKPAGLDTPGLGALLTGVEAELFQQAWVVDDLAVAQSAMGDAFGCGEFVGFEMDPTWELQGETVSSPLACAFARSGNLQIELMRPLGEAGVVAEFRQRHGPGPHHLGFHVDDLDASATAAAANGAPVVMSAEFGSLRLAFLDTVDVLGIYLELHRGPRRDALGHETVARRTRRLERGHGRPDGDRPPRPGRARRRHGRRDRRRLRVRRGWPDHIGRHRLEHHHRRRRGGRAPRAHVAPRPHGHGGRPGPGRPRRRPHGPSGHRPGEDDPAGDGERQAHPAGRVHDGPEPGAVRQDRRLPARRGAQRGGRERLDRRPPHRPRRPRHLPDGRSPRPECPERPGPAHDAAVDRGGHRGRRRRRAQRRFATRSSTARS